MAKRQVRRPREAAVPTPFEEARDEMFQHIMQCGVIGCEPEDQAQWFDDTMKAAKLKADVAFEFFQLLGVPFYCFHDADVRPEGRDFVENTKNLNEIVDYFAEKQAATGVKLLWGTANLFSNRRYMGGAATNPDPEVFAFAAATVKTCIDVTKRLKGENYVLWGGREGYETLLNTDMKREREHCCDDTVVQLHGSAREYAQALATLEELRLSKAGLSLMAASDPLKI